MPAISQLPLEDTFILSVWVETLLYGVYTSLFLETVFIILKKKRYQTTPSKVFFVSAIFMWMFASTHISINLYRMLRGYVWLAATVGPARYFGDLTRWDTITHGVTNAVTTWIGDGLVIYRCFIVWDNNLWIVIIPILMLVMSFVANSIALYLFAHLPYGTIFSPSLVHWMNTIYALAFVQNTLTTGLIATRIWSQAIPSRRLLRTSAAFSLFPIARIIVESAMIYVLNLTVLIILYALNSNAQYIAQEAVVPTTGIAFTMLTVRLAMHSSPALQTTARPTGHSIRFNTFPASSSTDSDPSSVIITNEKTPKSPAAPHDAVDEPNYDTPLDTILTIRDQDHVQAVSENTR